MSFNVKRELINCLEKVRKGIGRGKGGFYHSSTWSKAKGLDELSVCMATKVKGLFT